MIYVLGARRGGGLPFTVLSTDISILYDLHYMYTQILLVWSLYKVLSMFIFYMPLLEEFT